MVSVIDSVLGRTMESLQMYDNADSLSGDVFVENFVKNTLRWKDWTFKQLPYTPKSPFHGRLPRKMTRILNSYVSGLRKEKDRNEIAYPVGWQIYAGTGLNFLAWLLSLA